MVRHPGNHEFPDYEKNSLDLDFLLLMSCTFVHEFLFFKIKQQAGNCFTRYLQHREKQFPDKQFLYDASKHLNREIDSQLDPIIFDLGIHSVDKRMIRVLLDILFQYIEPNCFYLYEVICYAAPFSYVFLNSFARSPATLMPCFSRVPCKAASVAATSSALAFSPM